VNASMGRPAPQANGSDEAHRLANRRVAISRELVAAWSASSAGFAAHRRSVGWAEPKETINASAAAFRRARAALARRRAKPQQNDQALPPGDAAKVHHAPAPQAAFPREGFVW
jgi:hypothetical protein